MIGYNRIEQIGLHTMFIWFTRMAQNRRKPCKTILQPWAWWPLYGHCHLTFGEVRTGDIVFATIFSDRDSYSLKRVKPFYCPCKWFSHLHSRIVWRLMRRPPHGSFAHSSDFVCSNLSDTDKAVAEVLNIGNYRDLWWGVVMSWMAERIYWWIERRLALWSLFLSR